MALFSHTERGLESYDFGSCDRFYRGACWSADRRGTQYFLARQKEKAESRTRTQERLFEAKRAARLISADLLVGYAIVKSTVDSGLWNIVPMENSAWSKYSHLLAPVVSDGDWLKLAMAQIALNNALGMRQIAIDAKSTNVPVPSLVEILRPKMAQIDDGIECLKKWQAE